ncbi:microcystin-dependent protein [Dyadobacter sp. BE34]|uniref:Microcystin-dependent protein n=1 Tax=Dyadobacter fermentans TaxID=94254 RepID=A0ABU1R6Q2_9BACT|nr:MULTISPECIES: tail fiber protein [Dyadobacter]MDR6808599.1 microcystin-dependent protein [Dyadobacter fermentans]MDR7046342.1 microcystin-dependent protein [Dyadobacter sp. BE242]MDR7200655.1 microcystin-dependent protein [Dyadobacter sp. BE34]MDR7218615.1 microcystin-dependent protein [Dyadobacter sp. BE31]MDR7266545.1 microcystin-dependent protein [Dyadobacter sp. BE32]
MESFVGEIHPFAGERVPEGWHLCDGTELPVSKYEALFSLIGFTYGGSAGDTMFRLPDLRSRIPLGEGAGYNLGRPGGEEAVALTVSNLPKHRHAVACSTSNAANLPDAATGLWSASDTKGFLYNSTPGKIEMNNESIQPEGKGEKHENRIPMFAVSFIIALQGIFPSRG